MKAERKEKLLSLIDSEIQRTKTSAGRTFAGLAVQNGGENKGTGGGLAKAYLDKLAKLRQEVESFSQEARETIDIGSFALLRYEDGSLLEVCLVKNPVSVPSFLFVDKDSPLGGVVCGKREGESFVYYPKNSEGKEFSGVVIRVE